MIVNFRLIIKEYIMLDCSGGLDKDLVKRGPLRFKTAAEFEQDYGSTWRQDVPGPYCWVCSMDSLLGKHLSVFGVTDLGDSYGVAGWNISESMLTRTEIHPAQVESLPNYKDYSTILK